jgi:GT2 family glycosyltransferase
MSIDTAIIIVTYNGMEWVDRCLGSVYGRVGQLVIVVDNVSTDGTPERIRSRFPDVVLIKAMANLGFGKANNLGISEALNRGATSVFLLNQDAWLEEGALGHLLQVQLEHPGFGVLSPVHLNGAGDDLDVRFEGYCRDSGHDRAAILGGQAGVKHDSGLNVPNGNRMEETHDSSSGATNEFASQGPHSDAFHSTGLLVPSVLPVDFVNAAGWLVSGECLRLVGGFHPAFFMYGEDLDYVNRLSAAGFRVGICPVAKMFHDREGRPMRDKTEHAVYFFGVRSTLALCNAKRQAMKPSGEQNSGNLSEGFLQSQEGGLANRAGVSNPENNVAKQTHPSNQNSKVRSSARLYRKKDILDEIYKPFLLQIFRSPMRSIKILWRKLIILHRVRKTVNSIPEATGEYRYLSINPKANAQI